MASYVSCGYEHTLLLTTNGAVLSFGRAGEVLTAVTTGYGRLGHGDEENKYKPKVIEALLPKHVIDISEGNTHSLGVTADGAVLSFGSGTNGKLGHGDEDDKYKPKVIEALLPKHVIDISEGNTHSLCVTADGQLYSWGTGYQGQLGHGDSLM
eukprot:215158_1